MALEVTLILRSIYKNKKFQMTTCPISIFFYQVISKIARWKTIKNKEIDFLCFVLFFTQDFYQLVKQNWR